MILEFEAHLVKKGMAKNTVASYLSRIKLFLEWNQEQSINQTQIELYLNSLTVHRQTKNQTHFALKQLTEFLGVPFDLKNQFFGVEYNNREMPSKEEMLRIWQALEKYDGFYRSRNKAIISTLYNTGIRIDEARCLLVGDIDFENKTIFISKSKNKTTRYVPINSTLLADLNEYMKQRELLKPNSQHLFITFGKNYRLNEMCYGAFRGLIKQILRESDLSHLKPYSFRTAFATNLNHIGLAPEIIADLMGQKRSGGALPYYIAARNISPEQAVELVSKAV